MNWADWIPLAVAVLAAIPGLIAWKTQRRRIASESEKMEAEADSIHAQVAEQWAARARELQTQIEGLETRAREAQIVFNAQTEALERQARLDRAEITGLRLDIQQVRRENESYRAAMDERDLLIADLRDWAERLVKQIEDEYKGIPIKMRERRK